MKNLLKLLIILVLGSFAMQGFQCASREFTTAKVAYSQQDYTKAEEYLKKELAAHPENGEAYLLLSDIKYATKQFKQSADYAQKAIEYLKKPGDRDKANFNIHNSWIQAYNIGIQNYNTGASKNDQNKLDSAIVYLNEAIEIKPRKTEPYSLVAQVYEIKKDTAKAVELYTKNIEMLKPELDFGKEAGLYLDMSRDKAIAKIGKVGKHQVFPTEKGDSVIVDVLNSNSGKEVILTSLKKQNSTEENVKGWRVDLPADWTMDRESPYELNLDAFSALFQINYSWGKPEKALEYLKVITSFDPSNQQANSSLVTLYQSIGKTDEALKFVQDLTQKDPNNKLFWAQYGDIYQNMGKYKEAIEMYQKAVDLDHNFDFALRNIATAYKNQASMIQKEQFDRMDKDKSYKGDTTAYFPLLRESAKYFNQALETKQFENDYRVYLELAQLYLVLDDEINTKKTIRKLEAAESLVPEDQKEAYYLKMLNIYSTIKDTENTKRIQNKLNGIK